MHRHTSLTSRHAALTLVVGAASVLLGACGPEAEPDDPGYTAERRAEFVEACTEQSSAEVCACIWDRIEAEIPPERFIAVSESLAQGGALPDDLAAVAARCATDVLLERG